MANVTLVALEQALDTIRPALKAHGGNVDLVSFDEKTMDVALRLRGACEGCPLAEVTLKHGVEAVLKERFPEIKSVRAIV